MMLPRLSHAITKVTWSRRIPGFIAAAALSAAVLAAGAVPASASISAVPVSTSTISAAQAAAPMTAIGVTAPGAPAIAGWTLYGKTYPTKFACRNAGFNLLGTQGILTFQCVQASGGEFLYWQLWLLF
jgi:hypothetical protein